MENFGSNDEDDGHGHEGENRGLDAGYCYCYHTNTANPQAQLLLGQPGRCLQVLRSHPRRVSLYSIFYTPLEHGNELADGMGWMSGREGWLGLSVIGWEHGIFGLALVLVMSLWRYDLV